MSNTKSKQVETILAVLAASFIPVAVYMVSHKAMTLSLQQSYPLWILTLCGLIYSIPSVQSWAESWTGSSWKSYGFTLLIEGVMVVSGDKWLSIIALILLAGVNGTVAAVKVSTKTTSTFKVKAKKKVTKTKTPSLKIVPKVKVG